MTLTDVLARAAALAPDQGIVHVGDTDRLVGYAELHADALRVAGGLRAAGLRPGDPLLVVAAAGEDFLALFWGAVLAGVVPVPLPPEPDRLAAVRRHLSSPGSPSPALAGDPVVPGALSLETLRSAEPLSAAHPARPDDVAFLQFSSGSTGTPKGVELTHRNVVANLDQAARASGTGPSDVVVTWMPYFHDMGLIGTHLTPVHVRCRQVRISPLTFAKRPETWLRVAARHRGTVLSAANFALALVVRRVPDALLEGLDLSSVRLVMVGAEPISPAVWRAFAAKMERAGLRRSALAPVYGLAEATVAVAFPPMGEVAEPVALSRAALARGVALPVSSAASAASAASAVEFMDVGHPVPGCAVRIVDADGIVVEDGLVGAVQVAGPNVTRGYHRDPRATAAALTGDGWLRTGDIGFLRNGRLVISGREKDVLFVHGRNFHAADLEEVAAATPGLGAGPVAVVGATDPDGGRELVVLFLAAPAVRSDPGAAERARRRVAEALGYDNVRAEVVPRGAFARTTSGKLRRQPLRDRISAMLAEPHAIRPRATKPFATKPFATKPRAAEPRAAEPRAPEVHPAAAPARSAPEISSDTGYFRSRRDMEGLVRAVWARVLRIEPETIGAEDRFLAIGGSSLAAMEVLAGLEDALGRTLDPVLLRDCATVPALADRLLAGPLPAAAEPAVPLPALTESAAAAEAGISHDLAIIGMACRFPDADTPEQFWNNLINGRDSVTRSDRWDGYGAFLADPSLFDAGYFGIGDEEARLLDPHARIFLELAHEALERAGYAGPRRHGRRIGVFAAVGESGYPELLRDTIAGAGAHALTGSLRNLTPARVAHLLDLHGPAVAIDTACSSALVALHLARLSLTAGDCDVAIVGGVNLNLTSTGHSLLAGAQALSPTGRCRAFAGDADGFVPGEGGAVLVLTRPETTGGAPVLALLKGTAVNNDGRSLSLMAPNPVLQREVVAEPYRRMGVDPAGVTYIEAHGTGTPVGDPIEARSLAHAFPPRPGGEPRLLGSVKTNIGHLLNAAAMPALLKVILAFQHRELPPSLHRGEPSHRFDLAAAGFEVLTERRPWTGSLAAVNSFGFGGTNAHAVLAAPSPTAPGEAVLISSPASTTDISRESPDAPQRTGPRLLTLSAHSAKALAAVVADLTDHLREHPELHEHDVCGTASTARDDHPYRIGLVCEGDLVERLAAAQPAPRAGRAPRVAFLFTESAPSGVAEAARLRACGIRPDAVAGHDDGELTEATITRLLTDGFDTFVVFGGRREVLPLLPDGSALIAGTDARAILETAAELWRRGARLDRATLDAGSHRVPLPTYPFQRRQFWITPPVTLATPRWLPEPLTASDPTGEVSVLWGSFNAMTAPASGHLLVITENALVTGEDGEAHDPAQAIRLGLAMAWADENPHLGVRVIDLSTSDPEQDRHDVVAREAAAPPSPGPASVVAWRNGRRLARSFTPEPAPQRVDLPPDGSYLIVGGAGAAGSAIARDLARRGRPSLLLAGRSAEPVTLLAELRALGATAEYRVADIAVDSDVAALVGGWTFDVVVQAAGVVRPGSLRSKSAADLEAGLAAKVTGTASLFAAVARRKPALGDRSATGAGTDSGPLFIALSSVSSVVPGLGGAIGEYVAGNAFLDAFAAAQRAAGHRFVAVNLPALSGGGLANGIDGQLPVSRVPEILWSAAGLNVAQVLVSAPVSGPTRTISAPFPSLAAPHVIVESPGAAERSPHAAPEELVAVVRELLGGALDREPSSIGLDEPFLTLGLDSLTAVDLVKELETRLGRSLSTTLFFEHRTLGELAGHLAGPESFPLSPVQRAFHTAGRLYPEVPAYAYVRQTVTGPLDPDRLREAFVALEERHPMLRVRIDAGGQRFSSGDTASWFRVVELDRPLAEIDAELRNATFDLAREAPIRAVLAVERPEPGSGGVSHLLVVAHHAAADGYSLAILGDELWSIYGGSAPGGSPATTFAEHEALRAAPKPADLDHWRTALSGYPSLTLPFDGSPEPRPPYAVHQVSADPALTAALEEQARAAGVSLFHLVLAAYVRCLSRWTGQSAVPVLVARAGREARLAGIDRMVGPFADTLPVLATVEPGEPVAALAGRLRDRWLVSEQHGSVSSLDLARLLVDVQTASFSFARFPSAGVTAADQVTATVAGTASAATRLGLVCFEAHGGLHFSWNHPAGLFEPATVARFAAEHLAEVTALAHAGSTPAAEAPAHGDPWDTPELTVTQDQPTAARAHGGPLSTPSIVERIRAQCRLTPMAVAVLTSGKPLSYGDLDLASDRLAATLEAHLSAAGTGGNSGHRRVGLLTGRGSATVIGLLGILKANAAWIPLDATHPPARLTDQLTRTRADIVVCDPETRNVTHELGAFTLVDATAPPAATQPPTATQPAGAPHATTQPPTAPPPIENRPDDIAYVIFTSGSTGRPKAVPITHRSMVNYLDWAIGEFGYHSGDRLAQTASLCFDASVRQLLAPLLVGATVVTWDNETVRDPAELFERLAEDRVTVWSSVPTLWERLLGAAEKSRRNPPLRLVHVGGEELSPVHVRRWFDRFGPGQKITNLYGPTETTINATCHVITARPADDVLRLPIGKPIGGTVVAVLSETPAARPCAAGEVGELYIAGAGLSPGYLDDPEQTAARFVERDGRRWYRSGDRAVIDADGLLWFRGRVDDQVKLHGYRIEPGEVTAALRRHPSVESAAVRVEAGRLTAWVQPGEPVEPAELRAFLATSLPPYLVPSRFEIVPALPLTATGKVQLPPSPSDTTATPADHVDETAEPATRTERLLAAIWCDQLGLARVRRDDDYFQLGGDSIGVLDMFATLETALETARREEAPAPTRGATEPLALPRPTVIYRHRTLAALASVIDAAHAATPEPMPAPAAASTLTATPAHDDGAFPLTASQRGFLLADALGAPSTWLATPRIHGPIDRERFQHAVDTLVERHPMLRTVIHADSRPPMQRELASPGRLTVAFEPNPAPLHEELATEKAHRFDPARWPLLRLRLLRTGPEEHVLIMHAHHLIGDGYSVALLARELFAVYDGAKLPPLRSTFRDYVALLDGLTPEVVEGGSFGGGTVSATDFTVTGRVPFSTVLSAYREALTSVIGAPESVIGVAVTGRDHALPDLARIFGPCATAVAAALGTDLAEARTRTFVAPRGWRYFLTYLDFDALGPLSGETLRWEWSDSDSDLTVPSGTDVLLAARPIDGGLRVTLRGHLPAEIVERLAAALRTALRRLDAALIGYLPAPAQIAQLIPSSVRAMLPALDRESIRAALFPDRSARLLETADTPLGRSGFVCLPRFADELGNPGLAEAAAAAVDIAAGHGARTVSLAGMIPAHTGYGTAVSELIRSNTVITTGHAVTAASVVRTTLAALAAQGRKLSGSVVAVVGVGSIGSSSLRLLLDRGPETPAGLILCDLPAAAGRLADLADSLPGIPTEIVAATPAAPDAVYRADVIVAATSGGPGTVDVDRLRPGTIVVDDSFPHCFDTAKALTRMRERADVLIVGGGLLDCGPSTREAAPGLPAAQFSLPGTIASCQLESLLHATAGALDPTARNARPTAGGHGTEAGVAGAARTTGLPAVLGPVNAEQAAVYGAALDAAGVRAAPLHLLGTVVAPGTGQSQEGTHHSQP
ncbi:non-ribosomal peptide synthetase [Actinoplanes missouriensis]|nr:non-ribosomal peptide synthetase [Actinoplanes missouriensis]